MNVTIFVKAVTVKSPNSEFVQKSRRETEHTCKHTHSTKQKEGTCLRLSSRRVMRTCVARTGIRGHHLGGSSSGGASAVEEGFGGCFL